MVINKTARLKQYLTYVRQRATYLKILNNGSQSNEYNYHKAMWEYIKEWGITHALSYGYIRGKIDITTVKNYMGTSERVTYRMISKQRDELIELIAKHEKILAERYPFEESDIIDTEVRYAE